MKKLSEYALGRLMAGVLRVAPILICRHSRISRVRKLTAIRTLSEIGCT